MSISHLQRARLRGLVASHVQALNAHDLVASMGAFATHANLLINGNLSGTPQAIAAAYTRLGFSAEPGLFTDLHVTLESEHFTDEELIYEAHLRGKHSGSAPGFPPPAGAELELACVLMYRFGADDRLIAKHASIDFGPLFRGMYPMPERRAPETAAASVP